MFAPNSFPTSQRRGSVLLPTLLVMVALLMLLSATLPMTVSGYGVARDERDRAAALAAAEAGLNWEIARISGRLWDKDDAGTTSVDGSGNPTLDYWPTETGSAPATASTRVLTVDGSGNWNRRFVAGTATNPFTTAAGGTFTIIAEGQVRAADGQIVKRRVKAAGGGLFSLFDSAAIFALSTASPAWSIGGSNTVTGGCGSNGAISGNGGPSITMGPLSLWGPSGSVSGVTVSGITVSTRPAKFSTETADQAANLLRQQPINDPSGVAGWRPTGYDGSGNALGPSDPKYSRIVNSQAEIVDSSGVFIRSLKANEFLDNSNNPVLQTKPKNVTLWGGSNKLRLKPGVYYFASISLGNSDTVEIATDWYRADGTALWDANHNAINSPATVEDYNSDRNRVTILVDAVSGYETSSIGSGLSTALQGTKSVSNSLRYRRPGNFRIYAKNTGDFGVKGSNGSTVEFNANVLHYNADSSGNYYGGVTLDSGCHLFGGLFGWTITMKGSATVEQYGSGVFASTDPVLVVPAGGNSGSGGLGSGYGGWEWAEIAAS